MTVLSNPQYHHEHVNINTINIFRKFTNFELIHVRSQNQGIAQGYVKVQISLQLTQIKF